MTHDDPVGGALTSPRVVRALLSRHGLRADASYGQHFLVDERVLAAVVDASGVTADDHVLEVGPGLGVLTRELASRARAVTSIELDPRMLAVLAETLAGLDVELVHDDAVRFDFGRLPQGTVLAANLPYNVGTTILVKALESGRFRRIGVLLQREVADRLVSPPGGAAYGALSLIVAHYGSARVVRTVSPGCFLPPPAVTSAVVRIDVTPGAAPDPATFALVRAGFAHRRKTLAKNLRMAGFAEALVRGVLDELGLDPRVRAEVLDLATFRRLAERLPRLKSAEAGTGLY
jgi:16S rRNA (adenine1518-N6/adenine1519-N6)-dimethyltransferase